MPDGPPQLQNAPLNSNPMPAGMAPAAQPPQAPQPSPQQTDIAHHALLGKAVSALMSGSTTNYSVDPQSGQTVASQEKMSPGQWGRSMVLGAMLGLAGASGGDAKGGSVGGFMGGLGRGGTAVAQHGQEQDQQKMQRAQEQYRNQLEAQRNQREQDEAGRQKQAFQTQETQKQAMLAHENMETLRTQQMMKGESFTQFQHEAENGKAKVSPYVESGIQPVARDKTSNDMQSIVAGNPKAVSWDWEQTGVKTVMVKDQNGNMVSDYVPTFDAYDPNRSVKITKSFLDLMKKEKIDDQFPGTTEKLKEGQELTAVEFAALKGQYQKVYNTNMEMEKAKLAAGEVSARTRELDALARKDATDALRSKRNEKTSAQLADGLDKWQAAGGDADAFGKLDKKSQFFISTNLIKTVDSLERQIKDASNQIPPDQERMNELKQEQDVYRGYLRMAIPAAPKSAPGKVDTEKITKGLSAIANLPVDQQKQAILTSQTLSDDEKQEALKKIGTVPSQQQIEDEGLKLQQQSLQD